MTKRILLNAAFFIISTCAVYSQVTEQWVKRYSETAFSNEHPVKIVVDKFSGDIYVCGSVRDHSSAKNDILTIKYSSQGMELWKKLYNGEGNGDDMPQSMILDQLGGLIITGYSKGRASGNDCITIKYDLAGNRIWARRYNGMANNDDYGVDLATDGTGGVIVTGNSIENLKDIFTIKYEYDGTVKWINRYSTIADDGVFSIALDVNSDVYIAGCTGIDNREFLTMKINSEGNNQWIRTYSTRENDVAQKILVNHNNNEIYTIGMSDAAAIAVCYDYSGNERWVSAGVEAFTFEAAEFDGSGSIFLCGNDTAINNSNIYLAALDVNNNGALLWRVVYDSDGSWGDIPEDLALDNEGNIYIAAFSKSITASSEFNTIKYKPSGVKDWEVRYNLLGSNIISSLAIGKNNTVYVTGGSINASGNYDFATIKYTQSTAAFTGMAGNELTLHQNFPNPFNPVTKISYFIPTEGYVKLSVFDVLGKEITVIENEFKSAGTYDVVFDATRLSSGAYFYKLQSSGHTEIRKMILLK